MTLVGPIVALCELAEDHLDAIVEIEEASNPAPWSRELFAGELSMPTGERHWLVALANDREPVGFVGSMLVDDEAHIMNVAVDPRRRRLGIARVLLSQMVDDLIQRGVRHLTLEVRADNHEARSLYQSFGFSVEGERRNYYGLGRHALLLWARNIDQPTLDQPSGCEDDDREERP